MCQKPMSKNKNLIFPNDQVPIEVEMERCDEVKLNSQRRQNAG